MCFSWPAFLEFTTIHSKLWDAVPPSYHYLGYMTVSPNQTLLVFEEALKMKTKPKTNLEVEVNVAMYNLVVLVTVSAPSLTCGV